MYIFSAFSSVSFAISSSAYKIERFVPQFAVVWQLAVFEQRSESRPKLSSRSMAKTHPQLAPVPIGNATFFQLVFNCFSFCRTARVRQRWNSKTTAKTAPSRAWKCSPIRPAKPWRNCAASEVCAKSKCRRPHSLRKKRSSNGAWARLPLLVGLLLFTCGVFEWDLFQAVRWKLWLIRSTERAVKQVWTTWTTKWCNSINQTTKNLR